MSMREESFFNRAQELRSQILSDSQIFKEELTYPLAVAYFWPTKYCPVGCEHCMFASPKLQEVDRRMILSPQAIDNFIKISHESRLDSLVVSGGGEPMLELPTVLHLMKEAHFNYFEIITGAHWTANESLMRTTLDQVQYAISERKDKFGDFDFSFRISIDSFHQAVVKLHWLKLLVDAMRKDAVLPTETRKYPDINLFFRSLLIEDDTVDQFANVLNAKLGEMRDYVRELRFDDDLTMGINTLKVFYKDMRFVGRGKAVKAVKLMEFDQYFSGYADKNQDVRLGMTYLRPGSRGEVLDGINVFVTYEGKMLPYGGISDIFADIYTDSYADFLSKLSRDVISRTLLQKGLMGVMKIAEEADPSIGERVRGKNWIASVADESLATPELRLYITLRLLQEYIKEGIVEVDNLAPWLQNLVTTDVSILQNKYKRQVRLARKREYSFGNEVVAYSEENGLDT